MGDDEPAYNRRNLRGTDSNSLYRMYDQANMFLQKSLLQRERERADKAMGRIAKELRKRNLSVGSER
jgi:hypothetical protein